jgi:D-amino-acid dehydrogenase
VAGILVLDGRRPSARRAEAMTRALARTLPGVSSAREHRIWSGLRPLSPDGLPVIGRPKGTGSIVVAVGHGMMGVTLAPVTGALVREALFEGREDADLSPDRFGRAFTWIGDRRR